METSEERRRRLLDKANSLPLCPGVYIMRDRNNKVIYVGKSRKLKNRVSQYFQNGEKNIKTGRMVASVFEFDYYLCDTEMESLSLENTLIKQYTPKYNIRLKDAKTYPFIKIPSGEYPRLVFTRRRLSDKAKYFGPYSGSGTAYALIEFLNRTLRLPVCRHRFPEEIGKVRPCIYYQMGRCSGVCTGGVSPEEYEKSIRTAADILGGKSKDAKARLTEQMLAYADAENYEAAASCRDALAALDRIGERQKVVAAPETDQDVVALYSDDFCSCVSVFYVRDGRLSDKVDFTFGAESILDPEDMTAFLCEHYQMREYIPSKILLAFETDEGDLEILSQYLSKIAGHKVSVKVPERGGLHELCEMVKKNAEDRAKQYKINSERDDATLTELASLLRLETVPERIEAYDISNLGAEHLTAGMIVCKNGKFSKSDYRTFRIKSVEGVDDYSSMRETIARRLDHLSDGEGSFSEIPDLILLDGGRGHVSVIRELLAERGLDLPVFGMVKDDFHKTRALCTDREEISIARMRDVFALIYKIQDEVHRYTVGRMEGAKRKTLKTSVLTAIPGIGAAKAKILLRALGTPGAVAKADVGTIAAVRGISRRDAQAVWDYYHKKEDGSL